MSIHPVTRCENSNGVVEYHLEFDPAWDGLESFVMYLQKHWGGEVSESCDEIYSRRWVVLSDGVPISVYHDSQIGNYFMREDGINNQFLLDEIMADLVRRMG